MSIYVGLHIIYYLHTVYVGYLSRISWHVLTKLLNAVNKYVSACDDHILKMVELGSENRLCINMNVDENATGLCVE